MATTLNLRNTMNFVAPFLKNQPLEVSNMEPALMVGNIVLSAMLGPPLRWRREWSQRDHCHPSSRALGDACCAGKQSRNATLFTQIIKSKAARDSRPWQ